MYVCVCKGVTDGQIRNEACAGARSLRELRVRLGVAGQCGRCAPQAREVLYEALLQVAADERSQAAA